MDVGVPLHLLLVDSVTASLLSGNHQAQLGHGLVLQVGYDVLVAVAVTAVDALSVHHGQLVVYLVVEQVAEDHETHVATVVHAVQRVGTLAGQVEHGLRVDVHQFEHGGRQGVLHSVRMLELSEADG